MSRDRQDLHPAMLPWRGILIHHSLTADSGTVSWQAIRNDHESRPGWRFIGYHAGIEEVRSSGGTSYEVLMGRPLDYFGSHERRVNRTHIGLCFVGNYDLAPPPVEMLRVACQRIIRPWMKAFGIPRDAIECHRDYRNKSCPGSMFDLRTLLRILDTLPPADFSWRPA